MAGSTSRLLLRSVRQAMLFLFRREQVPSMGVFLRVVMPRCRGADRRRRALLTDGEFLAFVAHEPASLYLRTMAVVSRSVGGARTSGLHTMTWQDHVDTADSRPSGCRARRSAGSPRRAAMTARRSGIAARARQVVPPAVVAGLGPPERGARVRRGEGPAAPVATRAPKGRGISYAPRLRKWLRRAGVIRCELHHDTTTTRRVDFHSFRRSYVTAVGRAGVTMREDMDLADHRDPATHLHYHQLGRVLTVPESAVPALTTKV